MKNASFFICAVFCTLFMSCQPSEIEGHAALAADNYCNCMRDFAEAVLEKADGDIGQIEPPKGELLLVLKNANNCLRENEGFTVTESIFLKKLSPNQKEEYNAAFEAACKDKCAQTATVVQGLFGENEI